jgi:hypothetical protein
MIVWAALGAIRLSVNRSITVVSLRCHTALSDTGSKWHELARHSRFGWLLLLTRL